MSGTDWLFEIDPTASTATVHTAFDEDTVSVTGLAALATNPTAILMVMADAGPGELNGVDLTSFRFWFTADVEIEVSSGDFVVPADQQYVLSARGKVDADWVNLELEPAQDADGELDSETWSLDYFTTTPGGWVSVHLEGDVHATCPL